MESIQSDLDLLRAALTASARRTPSPPTATPPPCAIASPVSDPPVAPQSAEAAEELRRLRSQQASALAGEAERQRLRAEVAARDASLRALSAAHREALSAAESTRAAHRRAAAHWADSRAAEGTWRARHDRLRAEARALRREVDAAGAQSDRLGEVALAARRAAGGAAEERRRLVAALAARREVCERLRGAAAERDAALARESALQRELAETEAEAAEGRRLLREAREELDGRRARWEAAEAAWEAQRETAEAAKAAVAEWERLFTEQQSLIGRKGNEKQRRSQTKKTELCSVVENGAENSPLCGHDGAHDGDEDDQSKTSSHSKGDSSTTDTTCEGSQNMDKEEVEAEGSLREKLEAKVLDLALHLREQTAAAQAARQGSEVMAAAATLDAHALAEAQHTIAFMQPEWKELSAVNEQLQAALLARESHTEALQDLVMSLLDEVTQLSLHCHELEAQLALRVCGGTAMTRRTTALHLLQRQQQ